jgi:hypothetical protein
MQLLETIERPSAYGQTPAVVLIGPNSAWFGSKLHATKTEKPQSSLIGAFYFTA